ncbi:MAG: cation:proton antiporter, partial [Alicyclobacillaceae bacterium]|nr:cation:proton antiporter [Alicyclobacillaceae bacterium]
METQAAHLVHESLRLLAIVLTAGIVLGWMSKRLRVPDIVLYLLGGMLLGPAGLGVIDLSPGSGINQFVFTFGAAVILFHGGLSTELPVLRRVWITVILLVTAGVLVTALVVAGAASMALGLSLINALLVGAVIASTDPAALIPIFQKVRVKPELAQTVVAESAFNDAVGAMLVTVLLSVVAGGTFSLSSAFGGFVRLAGLGLAVGAAIGLAAAFLMGSRSRYVIEDYESVMAIAAVLGSYLLAERVGGSGFMAAFDYHKHRAQAPIR